MATTKQMQARASAKKKYENLMAKMRPQENTTSWVDEQYSRLLAAQNRNVIESSNSEDLLRLNKIRKSPLYLNEEQVVSHGKKITRVYFLDYSLHSKDMLIISNYDYDEKGFSDGIQASALLQVYLTKHAQERVYQRIRSNSPDDFKKMVGKLKSLPSAENVPVGTEETWEVEGGRFELVVDNLRIKLEAGKNIGIDGQIFLVDKDYPEILAQPVWIIKTFIANKPA